MILTEEQKLIRLTESCERQASKFKSMLEQLSEPDLHLSFKDLKTRRKFQNWKKKFIADLNK